MQNTLRLHYIFIVMFALASINCPPNDDDNTGEPSTHLGAIVADSVGDLPICDGTEEGQLFYTLDTEEFHYCDGSEFLIVDVVGPQGPQGDQGILGTDGPDSLIDNVTIAPGPNCPDGGTKVTVGVDANDNGILDPVEVSHTFYICDGAQAFTGDSFTFTAAAVDFNMIYVEGGLSFLTGISQELGPDSVADSYLIGETEVTYELWDMVYSFAIANGYAFANAGIMGDGIGDTDQHPVMAINWRDALVWTNALTEFYNLFHTGPDLEPVYYSDPSFTTVLKDSRDGLYQTSVNPTAGSFDNPYVKQDANGFRLPTMAEWSLAARYKGSNYDGSFDYEFPEGSGDWWQQGSFPSGSTLPYFDEAALSLVAVYMNNSGGSTAPVKSKNPNGLGLYDMTGNAFEFNFDWHPDYIGLKRLMRGGDYSSYGPQHQLASLRKLFPGGVYGVAFPYGFRLTKAP